MHDVSKYGNYSTLHPTSGNNQRLKEFLSNPDMEVVEVTESEITQRLVIEHNPLTTTIKWSISRMSPAVALGVLFRAAYSIFKDGFKKSANPQMAMNVLICYDHGTVTVKSDKSDDPTMLAAVIGMGMMTAANKMHDGGYESMFDES